MSLDDVTALGPRLARLGWHLQMLVRAERLPTIADRLLALPLDLVIDHMGLPIAESGLTGVRPLLPLLATGRVWIKLSAPYYVTSQPRLGAPQPVSDAPPSTGSPPRSHGICSRRAPTGCCGAATGRTRTARQCRTRATWSTGSPRRSRTRPGSIRSFVSNPARRYGFDPR